MYVMKSQDEIKRILETEGLKYTIRELSRRHNIELKRFSRLFPELTRQVIEKRKSIMRNRLGYRDWETDRKSTRLNSSHSAKSRMPSSA